MAITGMRTGHGSSVLGAAQPQAAPAAAVGHREPAGEHEVRDRDRATYFQDLIRATVQHRFPDVDSLVAAGYVPTRTDIDGPVHYTLGGYTNPDLSADGGVSDLSRPFSVIVEDGAITGVMLRAPQGEVDFGAGQWHRHAEDAGGAPLMHVWFDKPLEEAFGGHVPGFDPGEPMPGPKPSPRPPAPGRMPPVPAPRPPRPFPKPMPMPSPVPPPPVDGPGCCHSHGAHPTQFPLG